jgi:hypothetical protein
MYIPSNWTEIFQDPLTKKTSLWGFQLFGIVLLLFAPDNVLDISPVLSAIAHFMSGIVPSIDKWVKHSPWPQQTRLFFSYCWLTVPFQIVIVARHLLLHLERRAPHPVGKYFAPIFLVLFVGGWFLINFYFAVPYVESASAFDINPYKSKFVQAMYGVIMASSIAGLIAFVIWWIKNFRFIYFNK